MPSTAPVGFPVPWRRSARPAVALGLVAVLVAASVALDPTVPNVRGAGRRDVPVERFAEVAPGLFRGAQPDAAGLRALRAAGVRTVLDLRLDHDESAEVAAAGMVPVSLPMLGGRAAPAPGERLLRRFFEIALDPARRPVFVHCSHGRDRTGALFAAYRIEVDGWTPERALDEMRSHGFRDDHPNLVAFVRGYRNRGFAASGR